MIKVNKGKVELRGDKTLLRAELSTLIYALVTNEILTKEEIEKDIRAGLMSEKEIKQLDKELDEKLAELLKKLFE